MLHGVEDAMVVLGRGKPHWHTPPSVLHSWKSDARLEGCVQPIQHARIHGELIRPIPIDVSGSVVSMVSARPLSRITLKLLFG